MKRTISLIALAAICSAMMVSCKNKQSEPTSEDIQAQKVALADSVLAKIDAIAEQYIINGDASDIMNLITLSDEEKMVKPDYLLDPSEVNNFITKSQQVNALGIYSMDYYILKIYDMPTDAMQEAITKLVAELNFPFEQGFLSQFSSASEMLREEYRLFKERGEICYFWQLIGASLSETEYIISHNPELFCKNLTNEANAAYNTQWEYYYETIEQLAPYDEGINTIYKLFVEWYGDETDIDVDEGFETVESSIASIKEDFDNCVEYRNNLLK